MEITFVLECFETRVETYCDDPREYETHGICRNKRVVPKTITARPTSCRDARRKARLTLRGPQLASAKTQMEASAAVGDDGVARFAIDWASTGIDPLRDESKALLSRPWSVVDAATKKKFQWIPSSDTVDSMLAAIGVATDTEITVGPSSGQVELKIEALEASGRLQAGTATRLTMKIRNESRATAYRVVARTRSSVPALHKLQFSFGLLKPGQVKSRGIEVKLPDVVVDDSAMVVVLARDAYDTTARYQKRFAINREASGTRLGLSCRMQGKTRAGKHVVPQGGKALVKCRLLNAGRHDAQRVVVRGFVSGRPLTKLESATLATRTAKSVDIELPIPSTVDLDTVVVLEVKVSGANAKPVAARLEAIVGPGDLCPAGKLSRSAYRAKRRR